MSLPESLPGIRDASSVVVLRDAEVMEVLLIQRHGKSGFMAGAYVFPGGKVDEADCLAPERVSKETFERTRCLDTTPGTAPSAARKMGFAVAACRELYEEAGLVLGADCNPRMLTHCPGNDAEVPSFNELLMEVGIDEAIGSLNYFAHWVTPSHEKKRFDTRFFVARAPKTQQAVPDERECTDLRWVAISAALKMNSQNAIVLPPPTLKILEDLSCFENVDEVIEWTRECVVEAVMPKIVLGDQDCPATVILPWDTLYDSATGEALPLARFSALEAQAGGVSRIEYREGRWQTSPGRNAG